VAGDEQKRAVCDEKHENRSPAEHSLQPAADHRRDCRCDTEDQRDQRHEALRRVPVETVADDRAPDDDAGARGRALNCAEENELLEARRERTAEGARDEDREVHEHDRTPAERIRQRAVEKRHDCESEEIHRQRLLDLNRGDVQTRLNRRERRQVRVDRKRSDHRQRREERRETRGRGALARSFTLDHVWEISLRRCGERAI
jgi:hypothetical protein